MAELRRHTPKGLQTRERILAAGAELAMSRGVTALTLDDVKASAGVGNSQLYHYFRDKTELVQAIVVYLSDLIIDRQRPAFTTMTSLQALHEWRETVLEIQRSLGPEGGCPIGSLGSEVALSDDAARLAVSRSMLRWQAVLRDGIGQLRDAGVLRPEADPDALALTLMTALQGGLLLGRIHRSTAPLEGALAAAIAYVETFAAPAVGASRI